MHAGNGSQIRPRSERVNIFPCQFSLRNGVGAVVRGCLQGGTRNWTKARIPPRSGFPPAPKSRSNRRVFRLARLAAWPIAEWPVDEFGDRGGPRGLRRHLISGLRARVPVPEHGTSTSTRSKSSALGRVRMSAVIICTFFAGTSLRSSRARCGCSSTATMAARGLRSASNRVLPPGAAQQSRMRAPCPTSRATSCEASS